MKNNSSTSSHRASCVLMHDSSGHSNASHVPIDMKPLDSNGGAHESHLRATDLRRRISTRVDDGLHAFVHRVEHGLYMDETGHTRRQVMWDRFRGKNKKPIGWIESAKNTATSSVLNVLIIFIPITGAGSARFRLHASSVRRLKICWSQRVSPDDEGTVFRAVKGTNQCSALDREAKVLRLQRLVGRGETGAVYQAVLDSEDCADPHTYAVKIVAKGEKTGANKRLFNEFSVYRVIERARRKHKIIDHAIPKCYGMYESEDRLALITDYGGKSLKDPDLRQLSTRDKSALFKLIAVLHSIDIEHGDPQTQNILRRPDGSLTLIDFSEACIHKCNGVKETSVAQFVRHRKGSEECIELRDLWEILISEDMKGGTCDKTLQ